MDYCRYCDQVASRCGKCGFNGGSCRLHFKCLNCSRVRKTTEPTTAGACLELEMDQGSSSGTSSQVIFVPALGLDLTEPSGSNEISVPSGSSGHNDISVPSGFGPVHSLFPQFDYSNILEPEDLLGSQPNPADETKLFSDGSESSISKDGF